MTNSNRKIFLLFSLALIMYECILYFTIGLNQPLWADEGHFIDTINEFSKKINLSQIKHYNEMSTPLPFILYGIWGKIWGVQLYTLRIFSLIIAFLTYLTFYLLYNKTLKKHKIAILLTLFLIIQPYMIGLTIFVYTDMFTMFFLGLTLISIRKNNHTTFILAASGGLLCRQYFAFVVIAAGFYYMIKFFQNRDSKSLLMLISTVVASIPFFALLILWRGPSPQNSLKTVYLKSGLSFHPGFLILYITLLFIYLLPIIILYWKHYYRNYKILFISLICAWIYILFPIAPSQPAIEAGVFTVGFFHRFLRGTFGENREHIIFFLIFLLSLPIFYSFCYDLYYRLKKHLYDFQLFLNLSIISFLILMPFSYVNWEKYFLPVIPIASLQILLKNVGENA